MYFCIKFNKKEQIIEFIIKKGNEDEKNHIGADYARSHGSHSISPG